MNAFFDDGIRASAQRLPGLVVAGLHLGRGARRRRGVGGVVAHRRMCCVLSMRWVRRGEVEEMFRGRGVGVVCGGGGGVVVIKA